MKAAADARKAEEARKKDEARRLAEEATAAALARKKVRFICVKTENDQITH